MQNNAAVIQLTGSGNCTITADQAGDANYNAAVQVTRSFAIGTPAPVNQAPAIATAYNNL